MTGAEALLATLANAGVDTCFANPGTTELPLLAALDGLPGVRTVLGLFEGVCTGAADGYGRMTGRPATTLLHLGPGLANGLANLHNARRARSPVVNLVGDHASWHLPVDAPLTSDIAALARPVSGWVAAAEQPADAPRLAAEAWTAACAGQVATLLLPADSQWGPAPGGAAAVAGPAATPGVADEAVQAAGAALEPGAVLLLGAAGCSAASQRAAARIAAGTGARVLVETFPARQERGGGLPAYPRLPYLPEAAGQVLAEATTVVLAGARSPVAFFGYPGGRSSLLPDGAQALVLARADEDVLDALERLAERCGAESQTPPAPPRPERPSGALTSETLAAAVLAVQPEGAVVVDEAATSGLHYGLTGAAAPAYTTLTLTGGAIGQGLPCAVGAALACPDRPVIALQADGGGMYTLQALWTMAREALDVTVVLCANDAYRILQVELHRAGVEPGSAARDTTELGRPALDWVALARGMGVPGQRVERAEDLVRAVERALTEPGPHLVEARLA